MLTAELDVAAVSTPSLLADLLPPSDEQEVRDFYGVLVDWRKRDGWFARCLSLARCVRLRGGEWISPNQPAFLPRQRNESDFPAELQIPIVEVPDVEGLEELLQEAGVKPLAWRTLVLDFLMPILSEARGASATRGAAMTALRIYYDSMRTESGDQDIRDAVRKALPPRGPTSHLMTRSTSRRLVTSISVRIGWENPDLRSSTARSGDRSS